MLLRDIWRRSWGFCSVLQFELCENCPCTCATILPFWEWKGPARVNVFLRFLSYWYAEICRKLWVLFSGCFFVFLFLSFLRMKYFFSNLNPEEQLWGGRGGYCSLALYPLGCLNSLAWEPPQMPWAVYLLIHTTWENLLPLLHALAFINTISIIVIRIHYSLQKDKASNTYLRIKFLSALSWDCFILELFALYNLPSPRKKKAT